MTVPAPEIPHRKSTPFSDGPTTLRLIAYGPEAIEEKTVASVEELVGYTDRFPVLWVQVEGFANADLIAKIATQFKLHELSVEDILSPNQRSKAEAFPDYEYVVAPIFDKTSGRQKRPFSLFIGARFLLTFQAAHRECFDELKERLRKKQGPLRANGPDYLAYSLLDGLIDSYFPMLESYGERLDELEDRSLLGRSATQAKDIHRIKRDLFGFRRAVWPLRDAMNALLRDTGPHVSTETRLHFRDLYDHVVQLIDLLETYRELSSDLMDLHLSSMSNRMNEVMRVLTIIATIFIPITFIASLYGMNFQWMPELHWHYGYFFALGLMGASALAMTLWFWTKGWLRSFFPSGGK